MKISIFIFAVALLYSCNVSKTTAYDDGIYGSHQPKPRNVATNESNTNESATSDEGSSSVDYYGANDDYTYASRIRRFNRPTFGMGYYSGFYDDPFFMSPGLSFSFGYGWGSPGFGFGYSPWAYSYPWYTGPWGYPYSPYGWGYNPYRWGYYNGFYDGFYGGGFNSPYYRDNYASRGFYNGRRNSIGQGYSTEGRQPGQGRPGRNGISAPNGQPMENVNQEGVRQAGRPSRQEPNPATTTPGLPDNRATMPDRLPENPGTRSRQPEARPQRPSQPQPRSTQPSYQHQERPVYRESRPSSGGNFGGGGSSPSGGGGGGGSRRPR